MHIRYRPRIPVSLIVLTGAAWALMLHHAISMSASTDWREHVEDGGLISYGPDIPDQYRRAATYVDKLLFAACVEPLISFLFRLWGLSGH